MTNSFGGMNVIFSFICPKEATFFQGLSRFMYTVGVPRSLVSPHTVFRYYFFAEKNIKKIDNFHSFPDFNDKSMENKLLIV